MGLCVYGVCVYVLCVCVCVCGVCVLCVCVCMCVCGVCVFCVCVCCVCVVCVCGVCVYVCVCLCALYVDLSRFNNPCLKLPAPTSVYLTFQSLSFNLNQPTSHYRRKTCAAASVYLADVIFILFVVYCAYIAI